MSLTKFCVSVALLCLFGCDSENNLSNDSVTLKFSSPAEAVRTVDPALLTLSVMIDGISQDVASNGSGSEWSGTFTLPTDRAVDLLIDWENMGFPIARYSSSIGPITSETTLAVLADDYLTSGEEFDADGDGLTNLQELNNNTNPADELNIDVRIPSVVNAPAINGITGIVWAESIVNDWQNEPLAIDNLMIDLGATQPDGDTGFYWQAVHDTESLFIIVYAEHADNETPFADSSSHTRDDAINIFIDGDNSKEESYDGVNDYHIIIPFAKLRKAADTAFESTAITDTNGDLVFNNEGLLQVNTENGVIFSPVAELETNTNNVGIGDNTEGRRQSYGPQSLQTLDGIIYATGRPGEGDGQIQQVYEIQLNLQQLGVTPGSPFGMEIQIDADDDGGGRDARYAWKHRSKETNGADVNNTESNPQFMGTAILQE